MSALLEAEGEGVATLPFIHQVSVLIGSGAASRRPSCCISAARAWHRSRHGIASLTPRRCITAPQGAISFIFQSDTASPSSSCSFPIETPSERDIKSDQTRLSGRDQMTTINIYEAKTQLSKLVEQAAAGEDVIIARGGKPVARLTRLQPPRRKLRFGLLKGKVKLSADFDAPLPADVLAQFEGR